MIHQIGHPFFGELDDRVLGVLGKEKYVDIAGFAEWTDDRGPDSV